MTKKVAVEQFNNKRSENIDRTLTYFFNLTRLDLLTGCVEWIGRKDKHRHGWVWVKKLKRDVAVRRFVCHVTWGYQLTSKTQIRDTCGNQFCINPSHLKKGRKQKKLYPLSRNKRVTVGNDKITNYLASLGVQL